MEKAGIAGMQGKTEEVDERGGVRSESMSMIVVLCCRD